MAAVGSNPQLATDLQLFSEEFKKTFDHPSCGADAAGQLHSLSQGSRSVVEYTLEFRTLAADSRWDDAALRSAYRRGLSEEIKDLIVRDRPLLLQQAHIPDPSYGQSPYMPRTSPMHGRLNQSPRFPSWTPGCYHLWGNPRPVSPTVSSSSDQTPWGGRAHAAGSVAPIPRGT